MLLLAKLQRRLSDLSFMTSMCLCALALPAAVYFTSDNLAGVSETSSVFNKFIFFPIVCLCLFFVAFSANIKIRFADIVLATPYVLFILALGLARLILGDGADLLQLALFSIVFIIGYLYFRNYETAGLSALGAFSKAYSISFFLLMVVLIKCFNDGIVFFWPSPTLGIFRPQIGALIVSTELSNILAFFILTFQAAVLGASNLLQKIIVRFCMLMSVIGFIFCGAIGSIMALAVMYFIFLVCKNFSRGLLISIIVLFLSAYLLFQLDAFGYVSLDTLIGKFVDEKRPAMYKQMLDIIGDGTLWGVGMTKLVIYLDQWPHHNILGLTAGYGVIVGALYIYSLLLVMVFFMLESLKFGFKEQYDESRYLIFCLSSIGFYLHLKGFFHDTWIDYLPQLVLGSAIGAHQYSIKHSAKRHLSAVDV